MRADAGEPSAAAVPPAPLRALGDPLRWRICTALAAEELCVAHLCADLGLAQPLVSHHLRVLREAGLVHAERAGRWTYYALEPDGVAAVIREVAALASAGRRPRVRRPAG